MFKIGSGRFTWIAVRWAGLAEDGSTVQNEVEVQVELVDRQRLNDQLRAERDGSSDSLAFAQSIAKGWKGVGDADGQPLPFTPENFALLFDSPGFVTGWGDAYLQAWNGQSGIREKNSEGSPTAGPPAAAQPPKPAA